MSDGHRKLKPHFTGMSSVLAQQLGLRWWSNGAVKWMKV
jgi:hypothetical protein